MIRESPTPVCVVPEGHETTFGTIGVTFGFDQASLAGLELAARLARRTKASLCLMAAVNKEADLSEVREGLVAEAERSHLEDLSVSYHVWTGDPAQGIRDAVEKLNINVLVMGTHGRADQALYFLGSVTERIVRHPPCAVITTRPE
jgi:nucleotide-binding universal stress UspA family protein